MSVDPSERWQVIEGDAVAVLKTLPDACVQTCVTSPPYYGLRDYGTGRWEGGDPACDHTEIAQGIGTNNTLGPTGHLPLTNAANVGRVRKFRDVCGKCGAIRHDAQIGLEPTPAEYVERLVAVFREVKRVLRDDGTLWLNLGSSYAGGTPGSGGASPKQVTNAGSFFDGRRPSQSRVDAPSCDNGGTAPQGSTRADCACSCRGDERQGDCPCRHSASSDQRQQQSERPPAQTGRGSERTGCDEASRAASALDVPASTTRASSQSDRDVCDREATASACREAPHSSSPGEPQSVRMSWLNYTTFKQKDLVPIPWMVAMALQADGWFLRSDIIWSKPNPMPESVTDRPTKAHEYLFLLSKSGTYCYDADVIAEDAVFTATRNKASEDAEPKRAMYAANGMTRPAGGGAATTRNKRSVWTVSTEPYPGAHFAVMPTALVEPCIRAGAPQCSLVLDPFTGSGTVGVVALREGCRFVGAELNPEYVKMARERIGREAAQGMLALGGA